MFELLVCDYLYLTEINLNAGNRHRIINGGTSDGVRHGHHRHDPGSYRELRVRAVVPVFGHRLRSPVPAVGLPLLPEEEHQRIRSASG